MHVIHKNVLSLLLMGQMECLPAMQKQAQEVAQKQAQEVAQKQAQEVAH